MHARVKINVKLFPKIKHDSTSQPHKLITFNFKCELPNRQKEKEGFRGSKATSLMTNEDYEAVDTSNWLKYFKRSMSTINQDSIAPVLLRHHCRISCTTKSIPKEGFCNWQILGTLHSSITSAMSHEKLSRRAFCCNKFWL